MKALMYSSIATIGALFAPTAHADDPRLGESLCEVSMAQSILPVSSREATWPKLPKTFYLYVSTCKDLSSQSEPENISLYEPRFDDKEILELKKLVCERMPDHTLTVISSLFSSGPYWWPAISDTAVMRSFDPRGAVFRQMLEAEWPGITTIKLHDDLSFTLSGLGYWSNGEPVIGFAYGQCSKMKGLWRSSD